MSFVTIFTGARQRLTDWRSERGEREFLPAALEVIETPPSPTGRFLALTIMLFFVIAVAWATFGRVDEIATAPGRLIPRGDVKTIQPLDAGIVRSIDVQDGERVTAGQVLIELDPTEAAADRDRIASDLTQAELDVARLTALKIATETGRPPQLVAPPDAPANLVAETQAAMLAQADQQSAKISDLTQQISQAGAQLAEVEAQSDEISATIPMLANKEQIHHNLQRQGFGTTIALLDAEQQLTSARHELAVQAERAHEARDAGAALVAQRESGRAQYAAGVLADLSKAQSRRDELAQQLIQARHKAAQTSLRAPISGVVEQLAIHSPRGVVTPAEHLMIVVPDAGKLVIEARLADRDVGFVHAGQDVKVKVETFNFTRYGFVDGRVLDVSRDAVSDTEGESRAASPGVEQPSPRRYVARIALLQDSMMVNGRREPLQPGMAVTVDIRTGRRTIIDYLLSPIARKGEESLHER